MRVDNNAPDINDIEVEGPSGRPGVYLPGDTLTFTVHIEAEGARADTVGILLSIFGQTIVMGDTGSGADATAGDSVFSAIAVVPASATTGETTFTISARDTAPLFVNPNTRTRSQKIRIDNDTPTLVAISTTDADTTYANGQTVLLRAFVTEGGVGRAGLLVRANFARVDSKFDTGNEIVTDDGAGTYTIRYTIALDNTFADTFNVPVLVTARDTVGHETFGIFLVTLDNRLPLVRLESPDTILFADVLDRGRDLNRNANDTLLVIAEDSTAVRAIEYFVDVIGPSGTGTSVPSRTGVYDTTLEAGLVAFPIGALSEGIHAVYLHAQDTAGNWGNFRSDTLRVDRLAPTVALPTVVYPTGQTRAKNGDTVFVTAVLSDGGAGLDTTQIYVDASSVGPDSRAAFADLGTGGDATAGDGVFTAAFRVTTAILADTSIRLVALDLVPNTTVVTLALKVQDTGIVLIARSLDPDTVYANGQTIVFLVTETGGDTRLVVTADFGLPDNHYVAGTEVVANNGDSTTTVRYTISLGNTRPDSPASAVRILGTDLSGNTATAIFLVRLDNTGPTVRVDTPLEGTTVRGIVIETHTISDSSGIVRAELLVDGVSDTVDTQVPFDSFVLDTRRLSDGPHALAVRATDTAGNVTVSALRNVVVDNNGPQSLQIVRPDSGAILSETATIEALVSDVVSIRFVRFFADGANIDTDQLAPWLGAWGTRSVADGFHRIHVTAEDTAGNVVASDTIGVLVDNNLPTRVRFDEPADSAPVNETVRFRVQASDTVGLDRIEFWRRDPVGDTRRISTVKLSGETDLVIDFTWDARNETVGFHQIFAIAYDRVGHFLTSAVKPILVTLASGVDNIPPALDTVTVLNGARFPTQYFAPGDSVILLVSTHENGDTITADFSPIDSEYRIGDEQPFVVAAGNGNYEIRYRIRSQTTRPEATYAIPVTATDSSGNFATLHAVMTLRFRAAAVPAPSPFVPNDGSSENGSNFVAGDLRTGIVFAPVEPNASLEVFDIRGRRVVTLASGANRYIHWNVRNGDGVDVVSGYYVFVVHNPSGLTTTGKVAVVR